MACCSLQPPSGLGPPDDEPARSSTLGISSAMTRIVRPHLTVARIVAALVCACVVAVVAGGVSYLRPVTYKAVSVVFLAQVFPNEANAYGSTIVGDFLSALDLPTLQTGVAQSIHVGTGSVATGLSGAVIGSGTSLQVVLAGSDRSKVEVGASAAAHAALAILARQQVDAADNQVEAAQQAVNAISAQQTAITSKLQVTSVSASYQQLQTTVSLDKAEAVTASGSLAAQLAATITQGETRLSSLASGLTESTVLSSQLAQAEQTLQVATTSLVEAQGSLEEASSPSVVTTPVVTQASRLTGVLRAAIASAVVVVGLILALYALADGRKTGRHVRTGSGQMAPASAS
jgi:hypothetical protein